jgi:peptide/nickel transport system substrate-binding protein
VRERLTVWQGTALAAGAVVLALATGGCGGGSSSSSAPSQGGGSGSHRGGTMILLSNASWGTLDPAKNYTVLGFETAQYTSDGLVGFKRQGGKASTIIVPDLATSVPAPTGGGTTYVFHLRPGIHYSNGATFKPSDFVTTFKRQFTVPGPANSFYQGIVGGAQCARTPASCDLSKGVIPDDAADTLTIHLTSPDPEFMDKLALPFAVAVPAGTPMHDMGNTPIPGTGPYMWQYYRPNEGALMVRNPHFHVWSTDAQPAGNPDQIKFTFGLTVEDEVTEIENGQADWMADAPPADRLNEMGTTYASQTHINPLTAIYYMALNVNIPPFNNLKARQAINYGVDRSAYVKIFGGSALAQPSCQILPPNFPGYSPYCPYTQNPSSSGKWTAPDLAKARQLVKQSGTQGAQVAVVGTNDTVGKEITLQFVQDLNRIGYHATPKLLSNAIQYGYIQDSSNHVQVGYSQWFQDYPAASDFLNVLLGCPYFHPGSDASPNISGYCDHSIQAEMDHALKVGETDQVAANTIWTDVDKRLTDQAGIVTLFNPNLVDFVSKRIGGYQYGLQSGFLFDLAWVH